MKATGPIGLFDSGYGGLTVLKEIEAKLPDYDFIYLGDNARSPYGNRSFDLIYQYSLEAVNWLFDKGCNLVVIACNTASARALRNIQQRDLPHIDPEKRVLGIIRPVTEIVGQYTKSKHIGILGTTGTVKSNSYVIETLKFYPDLIVTQEACPMWVALAENFEHDSDGADYFIKKNIDTLLKNDPLIDTVVLGCTHYPLLEPKIRKYLPSHIQIISQGKIVAESLTEYLNRHPEMDKSCSKNKSLDFYTTENPEIFSHHASAFYGKDINASFVKWK